MRKDLGIARGDSLIDESRSYPNSIFRAIILGPYEKFHRRFVSGGENHVCVVGMSSGGVEVRTDSKKWTLAASPAGGDPMRRILGGNSRAWAGFLAFALLLGLMAVPASAQESGSILGTVKDTSGGTVPSAKVTIINADTNDMRSITTGEDGTYRVAGLRPGNYSVKVEKEGFK